MKRELHHSEHMQKLNLPKRQARLSREDRIALNVDKRLHAYALADVKPDDLRLWDFWDLVIRKGLVAIAAEQRARALEEDAA